MTHSSKIVVALDFNNEKSAHNLLKQLDAQRCKVKIGKELFTRCGPKFVEKVVNSGFDVFLDLKYHDIPNTVAQACTAAAEMGVWMINVHALGGRRMMEAAGNALEHVSQRPLLIAVTVLTSMDHNDLREIGLDGDPLSNVQRLASLAKSAGLDGVVCSAQEASQIRQDWQEGCFVTPGIRPSWSVVGDQMRVMTPSQAMSNGASYLVIGRPITSSDDPLAALARIEHELAGLDS